MNDGIKEILQELENMYEISELEEQVNNINKIRDYITNLQQAFEKSYTEEQLDFAVNEVKEQLKIEKQYSNQLCNEIDKLRIKNYELQQENERLKERVAYLERSNNRREDTILGLRQEINDVEDCNDELKKKLDKTLEVLQYELQFQTGGCYHRLSNLFDYLQNGSDSQ